MVNQEVYGDFSVFASRLAIAGLKPEAFYLVAFVFCFFTCESGVLNWVFMLARQVLYQVIHSSNPRAGGFHFASHGEQIL